jgi:hypothetical protein
MSSLRSPLFVSILLLFGGCIEEARDPGSRDSLTGIWKQEGCKAQTLTSGAQNFKAFVIMFKTNHFYKTGYVYFRDSQCTVVNNDYYISIDTLEGQLTEDWGEYYFVKNNETNDSNNIVDQDISYQAIDFYYSRDAREGLAKSTNITKYPKFAQFDIFNIEQNGTLYFGDSSQVTLTKAGDNEIIESRAQARPKVLNYTTYFTKFGEIE